MKIIYLTTFKPGRINEVGGYYNEITSVKDKIWIKNLFNTLTILNINGKVQNTKQTTFTPVDICANKDGDVYCTDSDSDKVFVVTSDGKEREMYSSPDMKRAEGLALDDHGDVYVAGYASNNIHRIFNDGQKHDIVLTADDGITQPTSLSYNCETREMLVINNIIRLLIFIKHNEQ